MAKTKNPLTLKVLNDKIEALTYNLDLLLAVKGGGKEDSLLKTWTLSHDGKFNKIQGVFNDLFGEIALRRKFITDDNENEFVQLPTIYVAFNEEQITISFEKLDRESHKLVPQLVSRYKNALIEGKVRSLTGVAPNFNQMSYLRFNEFVKLAGGEMLHWKTILYLQILWLFINKTKETTAEDYEWDIARYTGYGDTGNAISEFLGIEQLFSGYTFFNLSNHKDDHLFELFKQMGMEKADNYGNKFGYYKNFFDSRWNGWFDFAWNYDYDYSARLCKKPFEGVEGESIPFQKDVL